MSTTRIKYSTQFTNYAGEEQIDFLFTYNVSSRQNLWLVCKNVYFRCLKNAGKVSSSTRFGPKDMEKEFLQFVLNDALNKF